MVPEATLDGLLAFLARQINLAVLLGITVKTPAHNLAGPGLSVRFVSTHSTDNDRFPAEA